ncbi:MAG TPA: hypothetical protein VI603_03565 [Saprospiraceae bacterium]|nr:hypothetical protein [Saprospiraceae bacterium]
MKYLSGLLITLSAWYSPTAQRIVEGRVTDQDGVPLVTANILVKDTQIGTSTDFAPSFKSRVSGHPAGFAPSP